jgi:hypothetical protein
MPVVGYGTDDSGEQFWLLKNSCRVFLVNSQWNHVLLHVCIFVLHECFLAGRLTPET